MRPLPFNYNPALGRRNARLARLKRKGLTPAGDKASLRAAAQQAAASHPVTVLKPGPRPEHKRGQPFARIKDRLS